MRRCLHPGLDRVDYEFAATILPPPPPGHGGAGSDPSARLTFPPPPPGHGGAGSDPSARLTFPPPPPGHGGAGSDPSAIVPPCPKTGRETVLRTKGVAAARAAASATVVSVYFNGISLSLFVRVDLIPTRRHYDAPKVTIRKVVSRSFPQEKS